MDTEECKHVKHGECNHCHKYSGREEFGGWLDHLFQKKETGDPSNACHGLHQMSLGVEQDSDERKEGKDGKGEGHCRDGKFGGIGMEMKHVTLPIEVEVT